MGKSERIVADAVDRGVLRKQDIKHFRKVALALLAAFKKNLNDIASGKTDKQTFLHRHETFLYGLDMSAKILMDLPGKQKNKTKKLTSSKPQQTKARPRR